MLLFYEVVTRATRRLTLSYPALDAKAQPLLPSPYLVELKRTAADLIKETEEISLSPVPRGEDAFGPGDRRVMAVSQIAGGQPQRFAALLKEANGCTRNIAASLEAIVARAAPEFGSFDGLVPGEAARGNLAKRYGPEHCWSVSRLETYATCPFKFYLNNVLGLEELPDLKLETDYLGRGSRVHEALAILHRRLNELGKGTPSAMPEQDFARFTNDTFAAIFEGFPKGGPLDNAFSSIDLAMLMRWIKDYFEQHSRYDAASENFERPLRPAHFEVSFGLRRRGKGADALGTEEPFELRRRRDDSLFGTD